METAHHKDDAGCLNERESEMHRSLEQKNVRVCVVKLD
jgi:hypothetical protein